MSRDFIGALLQLNAEKQVPREQLVRTVEDRGETTLVVDPARGVEAATHLSLRDGLMYEATGQTECMRSADMREAITAFVEGEAVLRPGAGATGVPATTTS